jgi:hypothetical protein
VRLAVKMFELESRGYRDREESRETDVEEEERREGTGKGRRGEERRSR